MCIKSCIEISSILLTATKKKKPQKSEILDSDAKKHKKPTKTQFVKSLKKLDFNEEDTRHWNPQVKRIVWFTEINSTNQPNMKKLNIQRENFSLFWCSWGYHSLIDNNRWSKSNRKINQRKQKKLKKNQEFMNGVSFFSAGDSREGSDFQWIKIRHWWTTENFPAC